MKQLKRILTQKPEPLLLVVPLILLALNKIFISETIADENGQQRNFLQLDSSLLFWMVFVLVMVPFMLHFLLRASRKWDAKICRPHVYITLALSVMLFLLFYGNAQQAPLPASFYEHTAAGKVNDLINFNNLFAIALLIAFLVQLLFTLYFLYKIFKLPKSYPPIKRPVHS